MGITCVICGKKQSGFITDYELSKELSKYRICAVCNQNKEKIHSLCEDPEQGYEEIVEYFYSLVTRDGINPEVVEYLNLYISQYNSKRKEFLKEENERNEAIRLNKLREIEEEEKIDFLMTTGFNLEGYSIIKYNKVICSEIVLGTGFFSEIGAEIADFFGSESMMFGSKLEQARKAAINNLVRLAKRSNANAIIGVAFNYSQFGAKNMVVVVVTGTAVTVE